MSTRMTTTTPTTPQRQQRPTPHRSHVFHSSHVSLDFNYSDRPPPPPPHLHQHNHSFPHAYPSTPAAPDYPSCTTMHHVSHHHTPHFPFFSHNALPLPPCTTSSPPPPLSTTSATLPSPTNPPLAFSPRLTRISPSPFVTVKSFSLLSIPPMSTSTTVNDEEGCPAFSLINKGTGEALKHSIGATHPVSDQGSVLTNGTNSQREEGCR
ncbi:hypothetical protein Fmac_020581 [Flemingia macrophylla]|uniref:Uncharacterized protein n=1 Tax=Flemingia macrophylla TaxID=520843 RepID=A0ABD1LUF0_9FABA